jgi:hypothetical protein
VILKARGRLPVACQKFEAFEPSMSEASSTDMSAPSEQERAKLEQAQARTKKFWAELASEIRGKGA